MPTLESILGMPGHDPFEATPYAVDPNAFKNPYLTAGGDTLGSQANLQGQEGAIGGNNVSWSGQPGAAGFNAAQAGYGTLEGNLSQLASGAPGTSIAQQQLAADTARNNASAAALAATTGGSNPALAARQAQLAQGANNMGAAGQAVTAGIQERQAANAALNTALANQGYMGNAAATSSGNLALNQNVANERARENLTGMAMGAQQNQLQAQENQQNLQSQNYNAAQGINAQTAGYNAQNSGNIFGGATGAAGAVLSSIGLAEGGVVPGYAEGGVIGDAFSAFAKDYLHEPVAKDDGNSGGAPKLPGAQGLFGGGGGAATGVTPDATAGMGDILGTGAAADAAPLLLAADAGTVVPGRDQGVDTKPYLLRPGEVVTNQENPLHPYAKMAARDPAAASAMALHLRRTFGHAAEGTVVPPAAPAPGPLTRARMLFDAKLPGGIGAQPRPMAPPAAPLMRTQAGSDYTAANAGVGG